MNKNYDRNNVIRLVDNALNIGSREAAVKAIEAYEQFKDTYSCVGLQEFSGWEMDKIDEVFDMTIR